MKILNLENENRKFTKSIENFHVMEYLQDSSVSPMTAMEEYYMSKMNVRRRHVVIELDKEHSAIIQSGAMQWMGGHVQATAGIKGIGDLFGKAIKGAMTKESAVKPEYVGDGYLVLEPTYKYIILVDVEKWGSSGMTIEDGIFLACDGRVKNKLTARKSISSAVLGGEGFFQNPRRLRRQRRRPRQRLPRNRPRPHEPGRPDRFPADCNQHDPGEPRCEEQPSAGKLNSNPLRPYA